MVNNAVSVDVADKLQTPAAEFTLRKRLYLGFQHIRVLMVGPSVSGKSSVANAILGQGKFAVSLPGKTTKKQSDWQHINRKGRRIEVTELPGFVGKMEDCLHHEFNKAMLTTLPGPHVVFLCYGADSGFSVNEDHYKWLREFLADDFDKFVVLVFSGLLEHAFADEVSKKLVDDLNTRRRKVVFSANIVAEEQQNLMLETVCRVVSENNGRFFSNNKVESLEKEMQSLRRERAPYDIKRSIVDGEDLGLKCLTNPPSPLSSFLDQCKSQPVLLKAIALTLAVATIVLPQWGPGWLSRQLSR